MTSLWFTFFHEAGHILLHEEKLREAGSWFEIDKTESQEEKEADDFARDRLLPSGQDERLRSLRNGQEIEAFAKSNNVHPGIVVGRMQHEGLIGRNEFIGYKSYYRWTDEDPPQLVPK